MESSVTQRASRSSSTLVDCRRTLAKLARGSPAAYRSRLNLMLTTVFDATVENHLRAGMVVAPERILVVDPRSDAGHREGWYGGSMRDQRIEIREQRIVASLHATAAPTWSLTARRRPADRPPARSPPLVRAPDRRAGAAYHCTGFVLPTCHHARRCGGGPRPHSLPRAVEARVRQTRTSRVPPAEQPSIRTRRAARQGRPPPAGSSPHLPPPCPRPPNSSSPSRSFAAAREGRPPRSLACAVGVGSDTLDAGDKCTEAVPEGSLRVLARRGRRCSFDVPTAVTCPRQQARAVEAGSSPRGMGPACLRRSGLTRRDSTLRGASTITSFPGVVVVPRRTQAAPDPRSRSALRRRVHRELVKLQTGARRGQGRAAPGGGVAITHA